MNPQVGQTYKLNSSVATGVAPGQSQYSAPAGSQLTIKGSRVVNGQTFYDIDQTAFGGGTGWASASSLASALGQSGGNSGGGGQPSGGGTGLPGGYGGGAPSINVEDLYRQAYDEAGIKADEDSLAGKLKTIEDRRARLAEAETGLNENPFYAEATRVGQVRRLQEQAQRDIENYTNEANTIQNSISKKKADVETKLNLALKQYDITRQSVADSVNQFNSLLQLGALNNASGNDIASIARATGLTTGMIESAISKSKQSEIKPQVIQSTDAAGNVTVSIIDGQTGDLINQRSLGKIASGSSGTGSGTGYGGLSDKYVTQAISILEEEDTSSQANQPGAIKDVTYGSDKMLSAQEQQRALSRISALVGDPNLAYEILQRAFSVGGFQSWQ